MEEIKKIYRAWIEVKGEAIAAFANPGLVKWGHEQVQMTFRVNDKCAELQAIALGLDYQIDYDFHTTELLECQPKSQNSRLKNSTDDSNFQIVESELSNAIAYYLADANQKTGEGGSLEIVEYREDVVEDDQIAINKEGRIYVSKNLKDKVIKIKTQVIYERIIIVLQKPLLDAVVHIVCLWNDGSIKYIGVNGEIQKGNNSAKNQLKTVQININEMRLETVA